MSPLVRPFAFLLDKRAGRRRRSRSAIDASRRGAARRRQRAAARAGDDARAFAADATGDAEAVESLPLSARLGRSGDKGDLSNIGVIARRAEWLPLLWERLTPTRVKG